MSACTSSNTNALALASLREQHKQVHCARFEAVTSKRMSATFFTPAEFYKSLLASAVLQQQQQNTHNHMLQQQDYAACATSSSNLLRKTNKQSTKRLNMANSNSNSKHNTIAKKHSVS